MGQVGEDYTDPVSALFDPGLETHSPVIETQMEDGGGW